jgi:hypothetical protein
VEVEEPDGPFEEFSLDIYFTLDERIALVGVLKSGVTHVMVISPDAARSIGRKLLKAAEASELNASLKFRDFRLNDKPL